MESKEGEEGEKEKEKEEKEKEDMSEYQRMNGIETDQGEDGEGK